MGLVQFLKNLLPFLRQKVTEFENNIYNNNKIDGNIKVILFCSMYPVSSYNNP